MTIELEKLTVKNKKIEQEEENLTIDEKLDLSFDYQITRDRISNFVKLTYLDKEKKETVEYHEFWFNDSKRKTMKSFYPVPLDPRTCPTLLTFKQFRDKDNFPNMKEVYPRLLSKIRGFIYHIQPIVFHLVPLAAICSYFPEIFDTYPFFDFYGSEANCGKTTFLECLVYSSYHGHYVTDPSKAATFRTIHTFNGLMAIDELGKLLNTKYGNDYYSIILNGHRKGGVVPRCKEDKFSEVEYFSVHGIKAWSRLEWVKPELLSRAITILMVRNDGRKKLVKNPKPSDFEDIRNDLYILRLMDHEQVRNKYYELLKETELVDRTQDIFLPLLTIAQLVDRDVYYEVLEFANEFHKKATSISINTWNVLLMESIFENSLFGEQKVVTIRDHFRESLVMAHEIESDKDSLKKISSQKVMARLERLGFERTETRTDNNVHFNISKLIFEQQAFVYLKDKQVEFPLEQKEMSEHESEILAFSTLSQPNKTNETHLTNSEMNEFNEFNELGIEGSSKNEKFDLLLIEGFKTTKNISKIELLWKLFKQLEENNKIVFEEEFLQLASQYETDCGITREFAKKNFDNWFGKEGTIFKITNKDGLEGYKKV